jgi:hypothetical protein
LTVARNQTTRAEIEFSKFNIVKSRIIVIAVAALIVLVVGGQVVSTLSSTDLNPAGPGDETHVVINASSAPTYPIPMEWGVQSGVDNAGWTTVSLGYSYTSPVVVTTLSYTASEPSLSPRIRNASGTSFDVRVDRTDGSTTTISSVIVHYLVVESGTYTAAINGMKMEAATTTSSVTDSDGSWAGAAMAYSNTYTTPVVVGQVMTYNDTDWSAFWASTTDPTDPPTGSVIRVGKHVGEDADTTRADETLGYVVFETGTGTIGAAEYAAAVGASTVKGWDDSPPYTYSHSVSGASVVILSSAGMENTEGDWPVLIEPSPVTGTDFDLVSQEDQEADAEVQTDTVAEQIAYIVFE